ncbi:hypothetical protein ACIBO1_19735 [Micromonospora sp. NPDC049903]|uniref:hypothetical protein n=1 Tax=Micromonospora sp. NPDC049903 TaxID=3364276 RepID=UPI00379118A2
MRVSVKLLALITAAILTIILLRFVADEPWKRVAGDGVPVVAEVACKLAKLPCYKIPQVYEAIKLACEKLPCDRIIPLLRSERLECRVTSKGKGNSDWQNSCTNTAPASSHSVRFELRNSSGGYNYRWEVPPSLRRSVESGCTRTSRHCTLEVSGKQDSTIRIAVSYRENGNRIGPSQVATATIRPYCGSQPC